MEAIKLRYDGKYDFIPGEARQWTILSHFVDRDGADRFKGSFSLSSLIDLGIIARPALRVSSGCQAIGHCREHSPCCFCQEARRIELEIQTVLNQTKGAKSNG